MGSCFLDSLPWKASKLDSCASLPPLWSCDIVDVISSVFSDWWTGEGIALGSSSNWRWRTDEGIA